MKHLKKKTVRQAGWAVGCLAAVLVYILAIALSWAFACVIIKLITLCFGLTFSWGIATGTWLITSIIWNIFRSGSEGKK